MCKYINKLKPILFHYYFILAAASVCETATKEVLSTETSCQVFDTAQTTPIFKLLTYQKLRGEFTHACG